MEDETHEEPGGVVDARCGRDERDPVEDDGRRDVFEPTRTVRVASLPQPEWQGEENTDDDCEQLWCVDRTLAKLAVRPDEAPDSRMGHNKINESVMRALETGTTQRKDRNEE